MADELDKIRKILGGDKSDINMEANKAMQGLNMDQTPNQVSPGTLTFALNAALENYDANSINYQNEPGNEFCLVFPKNYVVIGRHFIQERYKHIFMLANPIIGGSEIGYMDNNDCQYKTLINDVCLNFDVNRPIPKIEHRTTNCSTEIYWPDNNARRYLDIDNIPYKLKPNSDLCSPEYTTDLDCNQLNIQPDLAIPQVKVTDVISGGSLTAGTLQFALQYSDALGNPYTSYFSVTNPTPVADPNLVTVNFNYPVGKSIVVSIRNIEMSGKFRYFNLAVIKTVNDITSVELVGTYQIDGPSKEITYSGQKVDNIRLTINDIFEKFPIYDVADDITSVAGVLVWKGLTSQERLSYQSIASKITLQWETWRIPPGENYANEFNATHLRGYMRDEIYPLEFVPVFRSGRQGDGFHIPGRKISDVEKTLPLIYPSNPDYIEDEDAGPVPYWKIYNTATNIGKSPGYSAEEDYKGPYEYGEFAYWESDVEYPCDEELWGELAGQKIRHHKFPDVLVSPIFEGRVFGGITTMTSGNTAIFPIGFKINLEQIKFLIESSNLTRAQKDDIVGFKIVRGNRGTNKSVIAKGILRNVNSYTREEQTFYYPNYPYNDLNEDPFLNITNNAYSQQCQSYTVTINKLNVPAMNGEVAYTQIRYIDCNTTSVDGVTTAVIGYTAYDVYEVYTGGSTFESCSGWTVTYDDHIYGIKTANIPGFSWGSSEHTLLRVVPGTKPYCSAFCSGPGFYCNREIVHRPELDVSKDATDACSKDVPLPAVKDELRHRLIFNSPETSFGQPFLGDVLKLESVIYGRGDAHFVEVKENAKYRLLTEEAQRDALNSAQKVGNITNPNNGAAMFTIYQAYLTIFINGITKRNFAMSFNSIASYDYTQPVPNNQGIKQRRIDLKRYLIPVIQNVGEQDVDINNYERETSVYLRTDLDVPALPFPSNSSIMKNNIGIEEVSRFTIGDSGLCATPAKKQPIRVVSYYASMKNIFRGQWGQIYSYESIDTGFQRNFAIDEGPYHTIFGGDTFITRFAFKTKVPFFIDNRVGAPDESDIFYDEIGNIAYPRYWHSARSITKDFTTDGNLGTLSNIISYKAHNFDCPNSQLPGPDSNPPVPAENNPNRTYYDGYFYLFAYGVPNFYVETSYNVDLRQAFNDKEGEFWPHVSTGIPDEWVQEKNVSILNDNTYNYNVTYSKQNRENLFTHLPPDWKSKRCYTEYPFRAIYSDMTTANADNRVNNWLTYRASNYFDFPQNHGTLVSIDGIENRQLLARFENKSLLYNALYTTQTNTRGQVYLGQGLFSDTTPPLDFAETDLGYVGSQHKFLLKIPYGQISIDAKRGQVFLLSGNQAKDLSGPGGGLNRFFTDHLPFDILKFFPPKENIDPITHEKTVIPGVNIDNNFKDLGLHGVYDSKYDRMIITKLDYVPLREDIKYDPVTKEFYIEEEIPTTTTTSTSIAPTTTTTTTTVVPICTSLVNPPINGSFTLGSLTPVVTSTGCVTNYDLGTNEVLYCNDSISLTGNLLVLGDDVSCIPSNFTYTINFGTPINNLTLAFFGTNLEELITITTDVGVPTITSYPSNCNITVNGNVISGTIPAGQGGEIAGYFKISNITPFSSITLTGNGGSYGSTLRICTNHD